MGVRNDVSLSMIAVVSTSTPVLTIIFVNCFSGDNALASEVPQSERQGCDVVHLSSENKYETIRYSRIRRRDRRNTERHIVDGGQVAHMYARRKVASVNDQSCVQSRCKRLHIMREVWCLHSSGLTTSKMTASSRRYRSMPSTGDFEYVQKSLR
jgi:hypothetical protein